MLKEILQNPDALLYRTNIQESNYAVSKKLAKEWGVERYRGVLEWVRLVTFTALQFLEQWRQTCDDSAPLAPKSS